MRSTLLILLALVLVLAACADEDVASPDLGDPGTAAPSPDPAPTVTGAPAPTDAPTDTQTDAPADAVALDATCVLEPDGLPAVELAHPAGWDVGTEATTACRFFDPEATDLPADAEATAIAVRWSVDPVLFARAAEPGPDAQDTTRLPTAVDGRQAVRISGASTGDALLPDGVDRTIWIIDLGDGVLVGSSADVAGVDHAQAVDVLDRMARGLDVAPGEDGVAGQTTVMRAEGGGAPYAVTHDASDDCLALFAGEAQGPPVEQTCDLADPAPVSAAVLDDGEPAVVVGLTSDEVDVVRLRANTDAARAVATVPVDGDRRGFALLLSGTEASVVAESFDGEELGRVEVLPER